MAFLDYLKPVTTIPVEEAREKIRKHGEEEVCLLDVRTLKEYEEWHLPGAVWIPIGELPDRIDELNKAKITVVYCAIGGRSRAGAAMLGSAGFHEVYNLKGGIKAWKGLLTAGPPDTGTAYFKDAGNIEDVLMLSWTLEEGARRFYEKMAEITVEEDASTLFMTLKQAETGHQNLIDKLYYKMTGKAPDEPVPAYRKDMSTNDVDQLMEGQVRVNDVIAWAMDRPVMDVLEYAIGLEAGVYDLYSRLRRMHESSPDIREIFDTLAKEEKQHLDRFTQLLEKYESS